MIALASAATLGREVQQRLVEHLHGGGRLLLHGVLPERDHDGTRCTLLADALALTVTGRVDDGPQSFPSVLGQGWAAGRAEVRDGYAQRLAGVAAQPVLVEVGSGEPCAVKVALRRRASAGDRRRRALRPGLLARGDGAARGPPFGADDTDWKSAIRRRILSARRPYCPTPGRRASSRAARSRTGLRQQPADEWAGLRISSTTGCRMVPRAGD
ncbi:hypothetical protein [Micromonospora sp. NPDC005299]|uniref:hypothetical protein n=1 Tax=Micromonospora sp. NPDC005299 TaxID=3364231 RepID=UPI0036B971CD